MNATITQLKPSTARKRTSTKSPLRPRTAIRRNAGVVEQVRLACSREHRLATFIGALVGALVPFQTFFVAHYQLHGYTDARAVLVLGGLIFSASTVYQWGRLAFGASLKAFGFTLLIEGVMVASSSQWLSIVALVYLCGINAIATGVMLARGSR